MTGIVADRQEPSPSVRAEGQPAVPTWGAPLPAWPLHLLLYGLPISWVCGALPFVYLGVAVIMLVLLLSTRALTAVPGLTPYLSFLLWALVAVVNVQGTGQLIGFLWRLGDLVALGIIIFYYVNAWETLNLSSVLRGLVFLWAVVVVFGILAGFIPAVRLVTPVGLLLPGALTNNPLVHELVFPRMAEIQQPWGVTEPYNRPAAPFPYTNSWGMAYALLTPVVACVAARMRWSLARLGILALLVASVVPAVATSNRGMFLGLGIAIAYLVFRLALSGRTGPAIVAVGAAALGVAGLVLSGAAGQILGRQEYSDSTGTRSSVYQATYEATAQSPLLGWGNPKEVPGVDVALGTQGYIWTLMYCFGFVGLALFVLFLLGAIIRTWRVLTLEQIALHGVLVSALFTMTFYGLGTTQLFIVLLAAVALLREAAPEGGGYRAAPD